MLLTGLIPSMYGVEYSVVNQPNGLVLLTYHIASDDLNWK